jgi:Zn-dependent protease with chaperone function
MYTIKQTQTLLRLVIGILIVVCSYSSIWAQETSDTNSVDNVVAMFGSRTFDTLKNSLVPYPSPNMQERADTILELKKSLPIVEDNYLLTNLRIRIHPALSIFQRTDINIIVYKDMRPVAYIVDNVILLFSTGLLELVETDAEILSIVSHELAHPYFSVDMREAYNSGDVQKLKFIELSCDAFAVAALIRLGEDPQALTRVMEKLLNNSTMIETEEVDTHPALIDRIILIKRLSNTYALTTNTTESSQFVTNISSIKLK